MEDKIVHQGLRIITSHEITHIQKVVRQFPKLSRYQLAQTLCEHMSWFSPSGALKVNACRKLLERLDDQGLVELPNKTACARLKPDKPPSLSPNTAEKELIIGQLKQFPPIRLQVLDDKKAIQLWNEYVERYHPLGHKRPFGNWLRYFLLTGDEILGCLLISGAAKALHDRDRWIGWDLIQRRRNLSWVINNSRYLILPWVQIPNLASHVLGQVVRRVATDWEARWGYKPVLMETFVDSQRYSGTCYQAAGWEMLGVTSGEGIVRPGKHYTTSPKHILAKPLDRQFRTLLCSEQLQGRIIE